MTVTMDGLTIDWLGYACARLETADGTVVYTDPGRYGTLDGTWAERFGGASHPAGPAVDPQDGDLILVTHNHHYRSADIRRVAAPDATVIVYEAVAAEQINERYPEEPAVEAPESLPYDVQRVSYGTTLTADGIPIEVIEAYNHEDGHRLRDNGEPIHPYGFGCGFRFELNDRWILWTGDSDVLSVHSSLEVSVFLATIADNFTMNGYEAASLAEELGPDLVIPIHYNTFPGLRADSRAFAAEVASRSVPVALTESWPEQLPAK